MSMNQAPSRSARGRKRQTRSKLHLILHWCHCSLRDPVDGIHKWLAGVLMNSQALQVTPDIVEHNIPSPLSIAINIDEIEFSSRVENPKENSSSSRQPFVLGLKTRRKSQGTNRSITNST